MGYDQLPTTPETPGGACASGQIAYTPLNHMPRDPNVLLFETPALYDGFFYANMGILGFVFAAETLLFIGIMIWQPVESIFIICSLSIGLFLIIPLALFLILPRRFCVYSDRLVLHLGCRISKTIEWAEIVAVEPLPDGLCGAVCIAGIKLITALSGRLRIVKRSSWDIYIAAKDSAGLLHAIRNAMCPGHQIPIQQVVPITTFTAQPYGNPQYV